MFTRKASRVKTLTDLMKKLLVNLDPVIAKYRKFSASKEKKREVDLSEEAKQMLRSNNTENDEDNMFDD